MRPSCVISCSLMMYTGIYLDKSSPADLVSRKVMRKALIKT